MLDAGLVQATGRVPCSPYPLLSQTQLIGNPIDTTDSALERPHALCLSDRFAHDHITHLQELFRDAIDWTLIETHLPDMLRVAISMLPVGAGSLWVCEGPCDVLALRTAGMPPVVATFGM
jgi:hypothetical protein